MCEHKSSNRTYVKRKELCFPLGGGETADLEDHNVPIDKNHILEELIHALNTSISPSSFCKNLVHGLLIQEQSFAAHILYLGDNSRIQLLGCYGYTEEQSSALESSVWSDSPAAQTIRSKQSLGFESVNHDGSGTRSHHVVIPFMDGSVPIGCLGLEFAKPYDPEILGDVFQGLFNLIGIAAINRFANRDLRQSDDFGTRGSSEIQPELVLSKRQLVVLGGMRDELSNAQIAAALHLSESSVKQETVRLFRALGVKNRAEARRIALDRLVIR